MYTPQGSPNLGLVFMLHGSAGAYSIKDTSSPPDPDNFGEKQLARACFSVALPHYLETLGMSSLTDKSEIESLAPMLLTVVERLLSLSETTSGNRRRVFLYGESLGAFLATAVTLKRPEISALSEVSGGLWGPKRYSKRKELTILISHGEKDEIVPLSFADDLARFCFNHGIHTEKHLYVGGRHYFSENAKQECIAATLELFTKASSNGQR